MVSIERSTKSFAFIFSSSSSLSLSLHPTNSLTIPALLRVVCIFDLVIYVCLCRIKSKVQQEHQKKTEQQTTNVFPRLSFLIRGGFCHEPRRLVSSLLLFEQEQVPLVQCRHLSRGGSLSLSRFYSFFSLLLSCLRVPRARGEEERRG